MALLADGLHASGQSTLRFIALLGVAYFVYAVNVAQYIHRTQRMKKELQAEESQEAA